MLSRSSKIFFAASAAAVVSWVVGTILIGRAVIRYITAAGVVDMTKPGQVLGAVQDPTFTATVSWGALTLRGTAWVYMLPILLAIVGALAVVGIAAYTKGRGSEL